MWLVAQELLAQLEDTKALREVKALQTFFELLNTDQSRAFYGLKHVQAACGRGAVEELLVTDALFRSLDEATRRSYVDLVEEAKAQGANVHVFSSLHVSGEALQEVCGAVGCVAVAVAAWLCGCVAAWLCGVSVSMPVAVLVWLWLCLCGASASAFVAVCLCGHSRGNDCAAARR